MQAEEIERFGKLLKLLASSHDGERAAAAKKATDFLHARKLDWHDIVDKMVPDLPPRPQGYQWTPPPQPPQPVNDYDRIHHTLAVERCLTSAQWWSAKEREFLTSMQHRNRPTPRQDDWLRDLYAKVCR